MGRRLSIAVALGWLVLLVTVAPPMAQMPSRTMVVHVNEQPPAHGQANLEPLLVRELSRSSRLRAYPATSDNGHWPPLPRAYYDADSVGNWIAEAGCRYLLSVHVTSRRLEVRKKFSLPLVFHRYQTMGVIDAEVRLFDAARGRFVLAEEVNIEVNGPGVFQGTMDDDPHDPDLHLSAPAKQVFMVRLEKEFCDRLLKRLAEVVSM